jgi:hypothetical protein
MLGHLKGSEFVDVLDGIEIAAKRTRHLESCAACRDTLATLGEVHDDVAAADVNPLDHEMAQVDWDGLRSSVRDGLLSRSVERSSRVRRWTGMAMKPAAAWSLGLVLLVSAMTVSGFWHYRTEHTPVTITESVNTGTAALDAADPLLLLENLETSLGGVAQVETVALGWGQSDLFSALDELESSEEDLLRELITEAADDASIFDSGVLR